ncbi:putative sporulation protein YtaF [Gracilibacillus orientalis]|uniref:Putative sporulation protein YtaF n=1 Tax=Gracilibacillus orientalis TaxID=334253 RepID=A0A1I4MWV7_9BACI|nr:manganese efflux pump [Gracilibacillus orientalis]SFM07771.1 putative sporulation protein YtaF [Gracilibacillus orientalis]
MMLTLLIIAISIDSFLVAFTYGLRGLTLPIRELLKISVTVGIAFAISMLSGSVLSSVISIRSTEIVGGFILAAVGVILLASLFQEKKKKEIPFLIRKESGNLSSSDRPETRRLHESPYDKPSLVRKLTVIPLSQLIRSSRYVSIRALCAFLIKILKKPMTADIDRSGKINGVEPFLIGIALSLDSFGAGIGIYMLGASPIFTPLYVVLITVVFLLLGVNVGKYCANIKGLKKMSFIPGCLLIIIGIWKMVIV